MGYEGRTIRVSALLDAHGGEREIEDEGLYQNLVRELRGVCSEYGGLVVDFSAQDESAD